MSDTQDQTRELQDRLANAAKAYRELAAKYQAAEDRITRMDKELKRINAEYQDRCREVLKTMVERDKLAQQLASLKADQSDPEAQLMHNALFFVAKVKAFLDDVGGLPCVAEYIYRLPDIQQESYISSARAVHDWSEKILEPAQRNITIISEVSEND